MKALFWLSLIVSILFPAALFGGLIFAFGGCVILLLTPVIATICLFAFFLLIPTSIILLVIDLIMIIFRWKRYGSRLFFPPVLIILGFIATIPLDSIARNICDTRFQKHFPQYQQAAMEIEKNLSPDGNYRMTSGTASLSYIPPIVYREDDGSLTIEFFVGGMGPPPRHKAYLYRSNSLIEKNSKTAKRWYHSTKVNEHWFRAID